MNEEMMNVNKLPDRPALPALSDIQENAPLYIPARDELQDFALSFQELMVLYKNAIKTVELRLNIMSEEDKLKGDHAMVHSYSSRIKDPRSIVKKMEKNHYEMSLESMENHLNDIAGVRVIVCYLQDVYAVRDQLLRDGYLTLLNEKDYIKNPKPNGYRSLHLIVAVPVPLKDETVELKCEIQIRTHAMDTWASLEHQMRYKKDIPAEVQIDQQLAKCADFSYQTDVLMQDVLSKIQEYHSHQEAG